MRTCHKCYRLVADELMCMDDELGWVCQECFSEARELEELDLTGPLPCSCDNDCPRCGGEGCPEDERGNDVTPVDKWSLPRCEHNGCHELSTDELNGYHLCRQHFDQQRKRKEEELEVQRTIDISWLIMAYRANRSPVDTERYTDRMLSKRNENAERRKRESNEK